MSTTTTIESLSDKVLLHILSFLPTKEVVSNCLLLSKRWERHWVQLRSLHFDETYHLDYDSFCIFVWSVILALKNSFQSLKVTSSVQNVRGIQVRDLNTILHAAFRNEIQQLDLHMTATSILLPERFYRCKTLVTIKLYNVTLDCPTRVDFPLLKSLILTRVVFINRANMFKFFRGCPNLEHLDSTSLTISTDCGANHLEEEPLPKLLKTKVSYSSHILFPLLCNAHFLTARMDAATMNYVENPMFHRLTHIDLTFASDCCNVMWNWFIQMLHNSPKLQYLTIHKESLLPNEVGEVADEYLIPECLSSQLVRFTLKYYKGLECEVQLAKYIIQNSKVLQNMTIHTTLFDLKHPMLETFSLYPKGSVTCNLCFDIEETR
ncbi:hypothetical protein TSUD_225430 [Trifolium subterraneum]|uniref:FBD domain-containing protein n=1 Tax=Trifolium subterraneum TaxID=3900 RepID=A0A2Z6MR61_TRISU|nr:hypothetical protein TSUD_225430 [Trifolium subterraneum]